MSLPRKQQRDRIAGPAIQYPESIPQPPSEIVERFPSMVSWFEAVRKRWADMSSAVSADMERLTSIVEALDASVRSLSGSQSNTDTDQIASLSARVSSVESLIPDLSDVAVALGSLSGAFASHIASRTEHGVSGNILGTLDASMSVKYVGATYTATTYNSILMCSSGVATSISLPTAVGHPGKIIAIKDWSGVASTANITVTPYGLETIDGASSAVLWIDDSSLWLMSDGANWKVV